MKDNWSHACSEVLVGIAVRILPDDLAEWGKAMRHEIEANKGSADAGRFAWGCIGFALTQRISLAFKHTKKGGAQMMQRWMSPGSLILICAIVATGLGLAYMTLSGAPSRYLAINASALALGLCLSALLTLQRPMRWLDAGKINAILGTFLVLSWPLAISVNGAARWISIGGLSVQISLIVLPVLVIGFARLRDPWSLLGIGLASMALALQPDRAMAGALAAGVAVAAWLHPGRITFAALAVGIAGFIATLVQPDTQPAMPYVDQILYTSFAVNMAAGFAVISGAMVLLVPALAGLRGDPRQRAAAAAFGALWLAIIIAAAVGNYPTPVVGYGGSAIIGYVLSRFGFSPIAGPAGSLETPLQIGAEIKPQDETHTRLAPAL